MRKIIYIIAGVLAVIIGTIGIFVPGLPTTPFMLLASWLFYNSSKRLHDLLNASWLGKYIKRYNNKSGVPLKTKLVSLLCMWTMMSISIFFLLENLNTRIIVGCLGVIGSCCILFIVPGERKREISAVRDNENDLQKQTQGLNFPK